LGLFYYSNIKGLDGFCEVNNLTTFVILVTEKSLKNLVCPFCAQIVPWLIFEQVGFDPHSNLKEMKLNYFFRVSLLILNSLHALKKILSKLFSPN
jgi:hypothetical protein